MVETNQICPVLTNSDYYVYGKFALLTYFNQMTLHKKCHIWWKIACYVFRCHILVLGDNIPNKTHYSDVIMNPIASQIAGVSSVCSSVWLGADHKKHQSSVSLVFVRGIGRIPVNSPRKGPVMRKLFPFYDVIVYKYCIGTYVDSTVNIDTEVILVLRNLVLILQEISPFLLKPYPIIAPDLKLVFSSVCSKLSEPSMNKLLHIQ